MLSPSCFSSEYKLFTSQFHETLKIYTSASWEAFESCVSCSCMFPVYILMKITSNIRQHQKAFLQHKYFQNHNQDQVYSYRECVCCGTFVICLTMDEVIGPKKAPDAAPPYTVHGARLQVNQHGPGHIFTSWKQIRNGHLEFEHVFAVCRSSQKAKYKCKTKQ